MSEVLFGIFSGMSIVVLIIYAILIRRYITTWKKIPDWKIPEKWFPKTTVSILIPARNEAANIQACLQSVCQQDYPSELFEILIIDDHSTDETANIIQAFSQSVEDKPSIKLIKLEDHTNHEIHSGKKAALKTGISEAKGELIVTTDADCEVPADWLKLLVSFYEKNNSAFIAAPVNFHKGRTQIEKFQSLDYMGMMLITGAGIHGQFGWMSNGANLAYPKAIFEELNGFDGIDNIASGDDMLFMQKVVEKYPDRIGFVKNKDATVLSLAQKNWEDFLGQRIRWAGKTGAYRQPQLVFTQSLVFLLCAFILVSIPLFFVFGVKAFFLLLFLFLGKAIVDFFLLRRASKFFGHPELMHNYLNAEWLHTIYIFLTGLFSLFRKEHVWKGRKRR